MLTLDEPTIGLDVVSQKTVREFLRHYNAERKTTVVLTSHYMADIQALRRRVIPVCKALLDEPPMNDIDIQEVPIEEVIRQIFAR